MIMNIIRAHLGKLYLHELGLYLRSRDTKKICSCKVNRFITSIDTLTTTWPFRSTVHSIEPEFAGEDCTTPPVNYKKNVIEYDYYNTLLHHK